MSEFDPTDPFRDFEAGGPMPAQPALPAAEIRRRGDRMRRRNNALATAGGVLAIVGLIGVPVALTSGDGGSRIQPAPQPSPVPSWITEIPADFPVTDGMKADQSDAEPTEGDLDAFALCDAAYPTSPGTTDTVTYFYSSDGESSTQRTLQLWPDDVAAEESLAELTAAVEACPRQPTTGGEDIIETQRLIFAVDGVDGSVAFTQQIVADDGLRYGLTTVQVTRVGNAVLVNSSYGAAGGIEAITIAGDILADSSETTQAAMCIFSAEPCGGSEPDNSTSNSSAAPAIGTGSSIPADFPLAEGLDDTADSEVTGPGPDVEAGRVYDVCGTDIWSPGALVDRLAVRETGIEYAESRELDAFVTADEPIEELTLVRDAVRDCAHLDAGYTTRVLDGPEGYDSVTWGVFADEGLDGGVYQITRVGSAVLVLYASGEMSESSLQSTADDMTSTTLGLAQSMCVFTEDGCDAGASGDSGQPDGGAGGIPSDFPLARGLVDDEENEVTGPSSQIEDPAVDLCGAPTWAPDGETGRLAVQQSGIEYSRKRVLVVFDDVDKAIATVQQVRDAVAACPRSASDIAGDDKIAVELQGAPGYDSYTWGYHFETGLGGAVVQVTRVGSAVLMVYATGEMSKETLQPVADEDLTPTTKDLAQEMCVFTADGC